MSFSDYFCTFFKHDETVATHEPILKVLALFTDIPFKHFAFYGLITALLVAVTGLLNAANFIRQVMMTDPEIKSYNVLCS